MGYTGKPREQYKRNRKQKTSGDKHKKALKALDRIKKRIKTEGETALLKNELAKVQAKLDKYGLKVSV